MLRFPGHPASLASAKWIAAGVFQALLCTPFSRPGPRGDEYFTGEGTFYGYSGGGNCSYPLPSRPIYTAAMNLPQYDSSAACGACVEVTGERGTLIVSIEDICPGCGFGDLDLSMEAFPGIGNPLDGRIPIRWHLVPCPVSGPIAFHFKEGSSAYWTAVQVRNSRYPIADFEILRDGIYRPIHREMYNYFLMPQGMGPGPYDFRITDMHGHRLDEKGIPLLLTAPVAGIGQFDASPASALHPRAEARSNPGRYADHRGIRRSALGKAVPMRKDTRAAP